MSNALYLRLPATPDAVLTGYRAGAAPASVQERFADAAAAAGGRVVALVPGHDVVLTAASLPTRNRKRMLAAVPSATVVVTNPTHFAVALRYERGQSAPEVVAKGADHLALRIRTLAREHGVPIVENPPLARSLYGRAEVGDRIPAELFEAVAEVLAYLIRLKQLVL